MLSDMANILQLSRGALCAIYVLLDAPKTLAMTCLSLKAFSEDPAVISSWCLGNPIYRVRHCHPKKSIFTKSSGGCSKCPSWSGWYVCPAFRMYHLVQFELMNGFKSLRLFQIELKHLKMTLSQCLALLETRSSSLHS